MQANNRIIINTIAQYARTIVNTLLSLYSSRLVLDILGVDDFGIYALVGSVVSLLSFLTNSLVASTQRFLSVNQGNGDVEKLKIVFSNSLIIHLLLGLIVVIILGILSPYIFNGFLNIDENRVDVAKILYKQVIWMVYISFITSPFRALLVSHENIVYTSFIDVLDGVLKVILVLFLHLFHDKLLAYGWIMFSIRTFNLLAFLIYCYIKYEECILPRFSRFSGRYLKDLFAYTGWMLYSTGIITLRIQGIAVVLNKLLGTAVNAAYGIGSQISGMISFVSSSLNHSIAPQLMSSSGRGNNDRMWFLAEIECKFSFLLLGMIGIPTMFEMPTILSMWLVEVPKHAALFGCMFITMQMADMLSTGLSTINKASGKVGLYVFVTYTPKLFIVPICWFGLSHGMPLVYVYVFSVVVETISMLLRIFMTKSNSYFTPTKFIFSVIIRSLPPVLVSVLICYLFINYINNFNLRFVFTFIVSIVSYLSTAYLITLSKREKQLVGAMLSKILRIK